MHCASPITFHSYFLPSPFHYCRAPPSASADESIFFFHPTQWSQALFNSTWRKSLKVMSIFSVKWHHCFLVYKDQAPPYDMFSSSFIFCQHTNFCQNFPISSMKSYNHEYFRGHSAVLFLLWPELWLQRIDLCQRNCFC